MAMFWEFFTFELRFRPEEHLDLRLLFAVVYVLVSLRSLGKFRSNRIFQRQSTAEWALCQQL